jgi:hypothetical protein
MFWRNLRPQYSVTSDLKMEARGYLRVYNQLLTRYQGQPRVEAIFREVKSAYNKPILFLLIASDYLRYKSIYIFY